MEKRRILFNLGVTYQTPADKLRQLPGLIKSVIESEEFAEFDRAHFAAYGDFSLNFEIVYFVTNPDFKVFREVQQSINFKIYDEFAKLGVEFAYPTQTIFLEKGGM
jgi:small-conductance mechanosensitive channel